MTAARKEACLAENTLAEFLEGRAGSDSIATTERHVAACAACRDLVNGMMQMETSAIRVSSVAGGAVDEEPSARLRPTTGSCVDRYVVRRLVGAGAMGEVYEAHDPSLDRRVALKLLRPQASGARGAPELRARLLREARALARLSHRQVITVFDVGEVDGELFIAMEFVEGTTLGRWVHERPRPWREVLDVFMQAGEGLSAAHEAGLVHRDFKPDNVLVGSDHRVRVTDFGLARAAGVRDGGFSDPLPAADGNEPHQTLTLTRTGAILGTPAYMAPEQMRDGTVDARADIFSFCIALYEALYGERPFEGATLADVRVRMLAEEVRAARRGADLPLAIRAALLAGLRANPAARFQSMRALLDALATAAGGRKRRTMRAAASTAGAMLVVGVVLAALGPGRAEKAARTGFAGTDAPRPSVVAAPVSPAFAAASAVEPRPVVASAAPSAVRSPKAERLRGGRDALVTSSTSMSAPSVVAPVPSSPGAIAGKDDPPSAPPPAKPARRNGAPVLR